MGFIGWTLAAVVIGVVVIGGALYLTRTQAATPLGSPITPGVVTPAGVTENARTLGNANAPVTLDIWEDFRCTGCFAFTMEIEPTVVNDYIATGKAKLVYHDLIVIDKGVSNESRDAANAGYCAADQGKFWLLHDWLFANQSAQEDPGYFTIDRILAIGQAAGLDMTKYEPCVRNGTHLAEVAAEQTAVPSDASATPAIYVNGKMVVNSDNAQAIPTADMIGAAITAAANPTASPSASGSPAASATATTPATTAPSATVAPSATPTAKPS